MRNFRKAALAGATAVAVAFGSTAVATAAPESPAPATQTDVAALEKAAADAKAKEDDARAAYLAAAVVETAAQKAFDQAEGAENLSKALATLEEAKAEKAQAETNLQLAVIARQAAEAKLPQKPAPADKPEGETQDPEGENKPNPAETTTVAPTRPIDKAVDSNDQEPGLSSKIADWEFLEFKKDGELTGANGGAIFGTGENNDLNSQPAWAKVAFALSIFTSVSAVVGLIVGPLYNYLVHGPVNF